jgi:hypothetical protein
VGVLTYETRLLEPRYPSSGRSFTFTKQHRFFYGPTIKSNPKSIGNYGIWIYICQKISAPQNPCISDLDIVKKYFEDTRIEITKNGIPINIKNFKIFCRESTSGGSAVLCSINEPWFQVASDIYVGKIKPETIEWKLIFPPDPPGLFMYNMGKADFELVNCRKLYSMLNNKDENVRAQHWSTLRNGTKVGCPSRPY